MRVDLRDQGAGHQRYDDRDYESAETRFVLSRLKSGSVVVDIGANIDKVMSFVPEQTAAHFDADYINLVFADSAG